MIFQETVFNQESSFLHTNSFFVAKNHFSSQLHHQFD